MHNKIFISANSEPKKFGQNFRFSAKFFWLGISWNENFIMQLAYCDKNLFYKFFSFIIEKFDFPVKKPWDKEVLWIYSFGYVWKIFIYHFWIPFSKNIMSYPGVLGWNYCHFGGGWLCRSIKIHQNWTFFDVKIVRIMHCTLYPNWVSAERRAAP